MSLAARRAAPAAVVLVCALLAAGPAHAQDQGLPPLSDQPPVPLTGNATPTPTPTAMATPEPTATETATATPSPAASPRDALPATGSDAGLTALVGASLLGMGLGLRRLADAAV
jgi:hypothetical protein